jgi:peptidyl-prolyl cis-trans isomerase D
LAGAVFGAAPGKIVGPVQGPDNYFVFNVTSASSGGAPPFALVADALRQKLQIQMAQARVNQDLDNVQDALAGQTPLDQLPGNLGLVAVEGTLDAKGNTPKGEPAPIPGGDALRKAIVQAVFAGHPGDAPQLMNGPDDSYFAFTIDTIQPPSLQPYDAVKQKVAAAWLQDAMQREAELKAVALLQAVNKGQSLDSAASAAGYSLTALPAMTRTAPPAGVSNALAQILFSLKPGQATMQQSKDGFTVLAVTAITRPSPKDDPSDAAAVTQAMTKAMQDDTVASLMAGFQARDSVRVNGKVFAQIYQ